MTATKHILLVEDNPGDAELIRVIITSKAAAELRLHVEATLHDSLSYLSGGDTMVDIVLLDLGLPDSTGLDGLKKIREHYPEMPVVVITGNDDQKMGEDALKVGAQDYIVKGLLPEHYLIQVIRYAIRRQEAEALIRQSEAKYRGIVDNLGIGVALIDTQKNVIETNEKLKQWFPVLEDQQLPKCFNTIQCLCEGASNYTRCPVAKTMADGRAHHAICEKGQSSYRMVSSSLKGPNERIKGVVVLVEDITNRLNMETKLRQAQKMESLGTLAGGVAHDFNNILTAIQGFATLAHFEAGENESLVKDLNEIIKASNRAADLVRQILTFSRMADFEKKPIIIAPLIAEVLKLLRSTLPANIEIVSDVRKDVGPIVADPTQIHQILMNLCTNAAHAMEMHGGTLTVALVQENAEETSGTHLAPVLAASDRLKLSVRDTGCGIPDEIKDSIFDPYFTTKGIGEGTGLGLSVVQGIIRDCSGEIIVESEPGQGSCFHLYFPVSQKVKPDLRIMDDPSLPKGEGRILLVDDEQPILKIGTRLLQRLGYTIHTEPDGKQALDYIHENQQQIDLIISDMNMPGMTGLELAEAVKKLTPRIPFIIMTGYSRLISPERSRKYGIDSVLSKPLTHRELAVQVQQSISR